MNNSTQKKHAIIAANRFGLGARRDDIKKALPNPKQWLINSLAPITAPREAPTAIEMMLLAEAYKDERQAIKKILASQSSMKRSENTKADNKKPSEDKRLEAYIKPGKVLKENASLIVNSAINSTDSINWRLLDFFSNHFSISTNTAVTRLIAPTIDWEAIAPNLMNSYSTMLSAVISHPAMLLYLNNEISIGPNSTNGLKRKKSGLNENLAREILELHTLGVNGGYTQEDVIELAKAISGWSIVNISLPTELTTNNAFIFRKKNHEPGERRLLNKVYPPHKNGIKQGFDILQDLAKHPSTASHVCTKLAQHFISDTPAPELINAMTSAWLKTNGHLKSVYIAMINSHYAWQEQSEKYKTPREFLISTFRALEVSNIPAREILKGLNHLGQAPYMAGSPAGYGDLQSHWDGADALYARIEWAAKIAKKHRKKQVTEVRYTALGGQFDEHSWQIISRAESQEQAIALLLMSPDFLYR